MTDQTAAASEDRPARKGIFWIAVACIAALGGGGAFYAAQSGAIGGSLATSDEAPQEENPTPQFLELDPALVAVGGPGVVRQLRFRAFLEVEPGAGDHVPDLAPRILDVCATYLRALDLATLEEPSALMLIRAQLLRRVQLLAGPDAVRDLLIVDFVIT
jgi:flagellar FliL protein